MLLRIIVAVALFGVILAPLVVLFTRTALFELLIYTVAIEAVLGALFVVFTDDFSLLAARSRKTREFERRYL
jgi:hypothetical protein